MSNKTNKTKNNKGFWGALLAVALFLGTKLKFLLGVLKIAKFGTLISMFVSLGAYALVFGWKFGVALVYLIFVHEMGHLIAAKQQGIKTSKAYFIPFVGALIALKEQPTDAKQEAYIAYGGPLLGFLSFVPAIPLYLLTDEPFWALVVGLGSMINIFNLMPVHPMDGGRIVSAISTKLWSLGLVMLACYGFIIGNPLVALIFIMGLFPWVENLRSGFKYKLMEQRISLMQKYHDKIQDFKHNLDPRGRIKAQEEALDYNASLHTPETEELFKKDFLIPFIHDKKKLLKDRLYWDMLLVVFYLDYSTWYFSKEMRDAGNIEVFTDEEMSEIPSEVFSAIEKLGLESEKEGKEDSNISVLEGILEYSDEGKLIKESLYRADLLVTLNNLDKAHFVESVRKEREVLLKVEDSETLLKDLITYDKAEYIKLKKYYDVPTKTRITWTALYLGLILVLGVSSYFGFAWMELHQDVITSR